MKHEIKVSGLTLFELKKRGAQDLIMCSYHNPATPVPKLRLIYHTSLPELLPALAVVCDLGDDLLKILAAFRKMMSATISR